MWASAWQGIPMQPEHMARFRSHVLEGRWGAALALLPQLAPDPELETQARPGGHGSGAAWHPSSCRRPWTLRRTAIFALAATRAHRLEQQKRSLHGSC